jgi:hypothetical protein
VEKLCGTQRRSTSVVGLRSAALYAIAQIEAVARPGRAAVASSLVTGRSATRWVALVGDGTTLYDPERRLPRVLLWTRLASP